jgi:hypothetical protein
MLELLVAKAVDLWVFSNLEDSIIFDAIGEMKYGNEKSNPFNSETR